MPYVTLSNFIIIIIYMSLFVYCMCVCMYVCVYIYIYIYIYLICIYLYFYVLLLVLSVCTKGLRVTQFQFSVCMYGTCGRIDNKADFDFLTLISKLCHKITSTIWLISQKLLFA